MASSVQCYVGFHDIVELVYLPPINVSKDGFICTVVRWVPWYRWASLLTTNELYQKWLHLYSGTIGSMILWSLFTYHQWTLVKVASSVQWYVGFHDIAAPFLWEAPERSMILSRSKHKEPDTTNTSKRWQKKNVWINTIQLCSTLTFLCYWLYIIFSKISATYDNNVSYFISLLLIYELERGIYVVV